MTVILQYNWERDSPLLSPTTVVYTDLGLWSLKAILGVVGLNLPEQRASIVHKIAEAFPNVTCIRLGSAIEWRRDATGSVSEWWPHVVGRCLVKDLILDSEFEGGITGHQRRSSIGRMEESAYTRASETSSAGNAPS